MKMKIFFALIGVFVFLRNDAQKPSGLLHSFSVSKRVNDQNKILFKNIEIDSSGNVHVGNMPTESSVDIKTFSKSINKYVSEEKLTRIAGNDDISVVEPRKPKPFEQIISITIIFLDDFHKDRNLRNKTYYSWSWVGDQSVKDYSFYSFLDEPEKKILKSLLE
jgi:hypothetical protein